MDVSTTGYIGTMFDLLCGNHLVNDIDLTTRRSMGLNFPYITDLYYCLLCYKAVERKVGRYLSEQA